MLNKKYWIEFLEALGEFILLFIKILVVLWITFASIGFTRYIGNTDRHFNAEYNYQDR